MHKILTVHLEKFRTWSYAQLAERVEQDRKAYNCLEHIEGTAPDGTEYQMEFQASWNDKPGGDIIVFANFYAEPQRPLLGFIPVYTPDMTESFVISSDSHLP
ncbi:MAG TPA: hypothetical protein VGH19_14565 [Verrucomicrobiae bacterium]